MDKDQFLRDDYGWKIRYLSDHFTRMWTRFNFFLTINAALYGFSFSNAYEAEISLMAKSGIVLSLLWFYFVAVDNHLVDIYRAHMSTCFSYLRTGITDLQHVSFVGDTDQLSFLRRTEKGELKEDSIGFKPLAFRLPGLSATEMAVAFPLVFFVLWSVRLWYA